MRYSLYINTFIILCIIYTRSTMFRKNVLELRNYGMFRKHLDFFEFLTI